MTPSLEAPARPMTRLRALMDRPNPIWLREMRQAARLTRTPVILATVTALMTLLICTVGGVASFNIEPAQVGTVLFHTFFSIAFFVVTWMGPGVAAFTIAAERSGRTWEPLLLTGLSVRAIANGKFAAAFTYISIYIVMLAPVGALAFLFGGVTPMEVVLAFVLLFVFAALSIGSGLSVSAAVNSPTAALVLWVPIAGFVSMVAYLTLGVWLSVGVHDRWPAIIAGAPVWLPVAFARVEFGWEYMALLVAVPVALTAILSWFFYEVTVANLSQTSDDRSSGLRRWFIVVSLLLLVTTPLPGLFLVRDRWIPNAVAAGITMLFGAFGVYLFAGDPLEPSRRTLQAWKRAGAGRIKRALGPGVINANILALMCALVIIVMNATVGSYIQLKDPTVPEAQASANSAALVFFCIYSAAFLVFLTGLAVFFRSRASAATAPRILLIACAFVVCVGPWILAGIVAATRTMGGSDDALVVAAPSPAFAFVLVTHLLDDTPYANDYLLAGSVSCLFWVLLGAALFTLGARRITHALKEHHALVVRLQSPPMPQSSTENAADESAAKPQEPSQAEHGSG